MIKYLDVDQVLAIHDSETSAPLLNYNALASAVQSPRAGFGEVEKYPTVFEKAAVLLSHLANNHAFHDGNKRCAWISCKIFLLMNGVEVKAPTEVIVAFMENEVVYKNASVTEIIIWLSDHQV